MCYLCLSCIVIYDYEWYCYDVMYNCKFDDVNVEFSKSNDNDIHWKYDNDIELYMICREEIVVKIYMYHLTYVFT